MAGAEEGSPLNERTVARFFFPRSTYFSPSAFLSTLTAGCLLSSPTGDGCEEHRDQQKEEDRVQTNLASRIVKLGLLRRFLFRGCCFARAATRLLRVSESVRNPWHGTRLWHCDLLVLRVRVGLAVIKRLALAVLLSLLVTHRVLLFHWYNLTRSIPAYKPWEEIVYGKIFPDISSPTPPSTRRSSSLSSDFHAHGPDSQVTIVSILSVASDKSAFIAVP